jgi:hypothetical protein
VVRPSLELTDSDLARLARLGGSVERISEAAGIEPHDVRRRLAVLGADVVARAGDGSAVRVAVETATAASA